MRRLRNFQQKDVIAVIQAMEENYSVKFAANPYKLEVNVALHPIICLQYEAGTGARDPFVEVADVVHETSHCWRQKNGTPSAWFGKYKNSPTFRLNEETEAYGTEFDLCHALFGRIEGSRIKDIKQKLHKYYGFNEFYKGAADRRIDTMAEYRIKTDRGSSFTAPSHTAIRTLVETGVLSDD